MSEEYRKTVPKYSEVVDARYCRKDGTAALTEDKNGARRLAESVRVSRDGGSSLTAARASISATISFIMESTQVYRIIS